MKERLYALAILLGLLALAACAGKEEATPSPATSGGEVKPAWEQEWERVLASAKQEATVTVITSARGTAGRQALTEPFQKKYGITVEYLGGTASENAARVKTERGAGKYLWDVLVEGTSPFILDYKPTGALDPIEPALILPEVKEGKNWLGGKLEFFEKDRLGVAMIGYTLAPVWINTNMARPDEIRSYRDLLDPKWRGKIVAIDPRGRGPGEATFSFFYQHKELGPDFIRALAKQELILSRDYTFPSTATGQGKYPICLACSTTDALPLKKAGVPIQPVDPRNVKEGGYLTTSNSAVGLLNRAPHPNAAKVYINWLLTKEGQTELARSQDYASRRLDVPNRDWLEPWMLPVEGFWVSYDEKAVALKDGMARLLKEVFGD